MAQPLQRLAGLEARRTEGSVPSARAAARSAARDRSQAEVLRACRLDRAARVSSSDEDEESDDEGPSCAASVDGSDGDDMWCAGLAWRSGSDTEVSGEARTARGSAAACEQGKRHGDSRTAALTQLQKRRRQRTDGAEQQDAPEPEQQRAPGPGSRALAAARVRTQAQARVHALGQAQVRALAQARAQAQAQLLVQLQKHGQAQAGAAAGRVASTDGLQAAGDEQRDPPGGVLQLGEAEGHVLVYAWPPLWPVGSLGVLAGLQSARGFNGRTVRVEGFDAYSGRLAVRAGGARAPEWRVYPARLQPVPLDAREFSGDAWARRAQGAAEVQWLSPEQLGVPNIRATADFVREAGAELCAAGAEGFGSVHERGVDVDASYYPRVRPAENWGSDTRANATVPESQRHLRTAPMPTQCYAPKTAVVPEVLPTGRWPPEREAPPAEQMQRATREGEPGTPLERVKAWCLSYHKEWARVRRCRAGRRGGRGKTGGSARFDYDALSEGGRKGLTIDDFFLPPFKNDIWDFKEYWASGGKARPTPIQFEHPQVHSEWELGLMAEDAQAMGYTDKNGMHDLTQLGHRSHASCVFDNKVCLFPNHVGFFKDTAGERFVHAKLEEDRKGFRIKKLWGSCRFPQRLTCRLHPRGIAVQHKPDGTVKRRLTCDASWPRPDPRERSKLGGAQAGAGWEASWPLPGPDAPDRRSFNDHCPLQDPLLVPPEARRYGTVDGFARGAAVLKASGLRVGMWAHDLRAYYRFMTSYTFDVHCNLQWCECEVGFEEDYNLQFGAAMNCAKATATSAFFMARIRQELCAEQERWRTSGRLDALPPDTQAKLKAWERERTAAGSPALGLSRGELADARVQWRAARLRLPQRIAKEQAWIAEKRRAACPWWTDAFMIDDFFGAAFSFFMPTVLEVVRRVFARYNVILADGRRDEVTGQPSPNKHQVSYDEMVILGVEISLQGEAGKRRLTEARAEKYALEALAMAEQQRAATDEFASLLGKLVFAVQVLPALRGVVAGLLGLVEQHWGGLRTMRVNGAAAGMLRLAARILREDEGMVLFPMGQPPGAEYRPVVWIFTDAARNLDTDEFTGMGIWCWPEGSDTVFTASSAWLPGEQRLHIAALELATANIGLELAQHVLAKICGGYEAAADADVIMVTDSLSAVAVVRGVRATSPALRVLVQERMRSAARRPQQRVLTGHCFREQGEEADSLSKDDMAAFRQQLRRRFGREMRVVAMDPPTAEVRSLQRAWEAELGERQAGAAAV